jgi:hypothetical protein
MVQMVAVATSQMAAFVAAISSGGARAVAIARSTASGIRSAFSGMNLSGAGAQAMNGLISGMNSRRGSVMATARSIASAASQAINSELKVKSPSRVTFDSGAFAGMGLEGGMESREAAVRAMAQKALVQPIEDAASGTESITQAARPDRSAVISQVASGNFSGGPGGGTTNIDQGSPTIIYSPTYRFEGGGTPNREDLESAGRMSQAEFEKYMKRYNRSRGRVAFA